MVSVESTFLRNHCQHFYSASLPDSLESAILAKFDLFVQELEEVELPYTYEPNDKPSYQDYFACHTPNYATKPARALLPEVL